MNNTIRFKYIIILELPLAFSKPINILFNETNTNSINCKIKYINTSEFAAPGTWHSSSNGYASGINIKHKIPLNIKDIKNILDDAYLAFLTSPAP